MFNLSSIVDDDEEMFVPNHKKIPKRRKNFEDVNEVLEKDAKKAESEEVEGEGEVKDDDDGEVFDPSSSEMLPFTEIGEFLLLYFKENPQKKTTVLDFVHPETNEKFRIHVVKFYNSFSDFPVKIRIRGKTFIFKQVLSMYPDFYAMEVFKKLNEQWEANRVNAKIVTYTVFPLAISVDLKGKKEFCFCGFIHFCQGPCMMNVSTETLLKLVHNDPVRPKEEIVNGFIQSFVGSTVGNFIVGLGDRHNYNVLLTPDVKVCHIDLNVCFGEQDVPLERFGLIGSPSLYMPQTVINFLKHKDIDKLAYFKKEVISAFNILPDFDEISKCLGHELQMKFVHDKMYKYSAGKILENLFKFGNILNKEIRDFFAKETGAGPYRLELKKEQHELVHIICQKIYRVSLKGLYSMEHAENWGNVSRSFCQNKEKNEVFLISRFTGWMYVYYQIEGKFRVLSRQDWIGTKGMVYNDRYLYIICQGRLYRMNVEDGQYKKSKHNLRWAKDVFRSTVLFGKLYLFEKDSNVMRVFDPRKRRTEFEKVVVENVEKFAIGRVVIGCEAHRCIYFMDPSIYSLGVEDKMESLRRCSQKKWENVRAAVAFGSNLDVLVVEGDDLILWNPENDEKKKISYGKKWGSTSLAF